MNEAIRTCHLLKQSIHHQALAIQLPIENQLPNLTGKNLQGQRLSSLREKGLYTCGFTLVFKEDSSRQKN